MPVSLETLSHPNANDLNDLIHIYQDYPPLAPITNDIKQWVEQQLQLKQQLFVGRFNGRLLTAVWAVDHGNHWQLQHLCVREITRRRGVAKQLLNLLKQHAKPEQKHCVVKGESLNQSCQRLLTATGFEYNDNDHHWIQAGGPL